MNNTISAPDTTKSPLFRRPNDCMQSLCAGVIAGCVTRTCTSPLDVLKVVVQVKSHATWTRLLNETSSQSISCSAFRPSVTRPPWALSSCYINRTVQRLYQSDGVCGFWRGNLIGCCRLGPYSGTKFLLFDMLQKRINEVPSKYEVASCGAVAGLIATLVTYPLEVVRTRVITQRFAVSSGLENIQGLRHGLHQIIKLEGVRGLYCGSASGLLGVIPFEGVQFGCYEYLKSRFTQKRYTLCSWPDSKLELDTVDFLVCGSIAGVAGQMVSYPFDTVKKRLQLPPVAGEIAYTGMRDCFSRIVREEGFLALYRGTVPNLIRIVPYAALMFSTFESSKRLLDTMSEYQYIGNETWDDDFTEAHARLY